MVLPVLEFPRQMPRLRLAFQPEASAASWQRRAAAYLCDLLIVGVATALCIAVFRGLHDVFASAQGGAVWAARSQIHVRLFRELVSGLVFTAYMWLVPWFTDGQTAGKRLFGLRVVRPAGELSLGYCLCRSLTYQISYLPLGVGFLFPWFRRDGRTLHDLVAGSHVIHEQKTPRSAPGTSHQAAA